MFPLQDDLEHFVNDLNYKSVEFVAGNAVRNKTGYDIQILSFLCYVPLL